MIKKKKLQIKQVIKEYNEASKLEILEAIIENGLYGFLGAMPVVFITTGKDIFILLSFIAYYYMVSVLINRPKYITSLGKIVVFPIASAVGAYFGYKLSEILLPYI